MGVASGLFPSPPVPLTTLKQDVDDLTTFNAAAMEGGKKDKAQRDKARKSLERNLSLLAAYVLKVADGDPAVVTEPVLSLHHHVSILRRTPWGSQRSLQSSKAIPVNCSFL
jgi:hypothetical protein